MDKELMQALARRAGLDKALAEFPDDVEAAAKQAASVADKIKAPADPRANPGRRCARETDYERRCHRRHDQLALAVGRPGGARHRPPRTLARRADAGAARSHRAARPQAERLHPRRWRGRPSGRAHRRDRDRRRPLARALARRAGRYQGHHRCRRPAHDRPFGVLADSAAATADAVCVSKLRQAYRAGQALDARIRHRRAEPRSAPAPARNPWNPDHHPGGSSSGSSLPSPQALPDGAGSDTGAACAIPRAAVASSGWKPTYGLVSRRGVSRSPSRSTISGR